MTASLAQLQSPFEFNTIEQLVVANGAIGRLLLACLLGGLIGLERELSRKSAGVRTNLLICMGAAFFTLLGEVLAGSPNQSRGQVASNIVQGIGFLGAGLILHNRSRVSGLASAASIWVVASIGMACGAGLYMAAGAATVIVILAFVGVGLLEVRANLKAYPVTYEVRGLDKSSMLGAILEAMDDAGQRLTDMQVDAIGEMQRVTFPLAATRRQHERLCADLNGKPEIGKLYVFRDLEDD
jgi:putative Mg2+ transporter-C (MgtC) family protein